MTNSKSTKRALITSVIAILMCVAMLVGTTFAWFTDTASTSVNKIQAGTLDIELQMKNAAGEWESAEGKTLNFVKAAGHEAEAILWEPGCTYALPELRVVNKGNLALKYKVVVTGVIGNSKLLEAIEFTGLDNVGDVDHLLAGEAASEPIKIVGHMKNDAGNEYQGLSADGISVTVYATQYNHEFDSSNNTYDGGIGLITTYDELTMAFALAKADDCVLLSGDIDTLGNVANMNNSREQNVVLDMNGKTIGSSKDIWNDGSYHWSLMSVQGENKTLTIKGNGTFKAKANDSYAIDVRRGATVVIKDGTYIGNINAIYVERGNLLIEGGFFDIVQKHPSQGSDFLLNCLDDNYNAGTAKITVKGGTFVNFNPAASYSEPNGPVSFVPDGYKVVSETQANGDVWYTVVAA